MFERTTKHRNNERYTAQRFYSRDVFVHPQVEKQLSFLAEGALAAWPWPMPARAALLRTRLVAHRGQRDDQQVKENTFAAFDPVVDAGVAAIEFDVRFTRDEEPVVVHDADLLRVFGHNVSVADLSFAKLALMVPQLPHLEALIARYAGRAHLMIELKTRGSQNAERRLADVLGLLTPVADYHLLSLDTDLFAALPDLPGDVRLPVSKTNTQAMLDWSLAHPSAGLAGAQFFLRQSHIQQLRDSGRAIGSGFVERRGTLWREIGRGAEWIFSNNPVPLQRMLDEAIGCA